MQTIIRLKPNELTADFIERIKGIFGSEKEIEISITPVSDLGLNEPEDREQYVERVNKAIDNLEKDRGTVVFSTDEFKTLTDDLLK